MWQAAPGGSTRAEGCTSGISCEEIPVLWTIVAVLLILWLLGFSLHVAGGLFAPVAGGSFGSGRHQFG